MGFSAFATRGTDRRAKSPTRSPLSQGPGKSFPQRAKDVERGRGKNGVMEGEARKRKKKKKTKITFMVQAASEIIFHISATAWVQWEREFDFLCPEPTENGMGIKTRSLERSCRMLEQETERKTARSLFGVFHQHSCIRTILTLFADHFWSSHTNPIWSHCPMYIWCKQGPLRLVMPWPFLSGFSPKGRETARVRKQTGRYDSMFLPGAWFCMESQLRLLLWAQQNLVIQLLIPNKGFSTLYIADVQ